MYTNVFVVGVTAFPSTFTTISSAVNVFVVIPECISVIFNGIVIVVSEFALLVLALPFIATTGAVLSNLAVAVAFTVVALSKLSFIPFFTHKYCVPVTPFFVTVVLTVLVPAVVVISFVCHVVGTVVLDVLQA